MNHNHGHACMYSINNLHFFLPTVQVTVFILYMIFLTENKHYNDKVKITVIKISVYCTHIKIVQLTKIDVSYRIKVSALSLAITGKLFKR